MLTENMKKFAPLMLVAVVSGTGVGLLFSDGCGSVERGIRALLGTWDMWDTASVSPYEQLLRQMPAEDPVAFAHGSLDTAFDSGESADPYSLARRAANDMSSTTRRKQAALAYRRYCHHCHGGNGDNRSMVGESFGFVLPDLRTPKVQERQDREIFDFLTMGSERMISLKTTMTVLERVLAVMHLRTLQGKPSVPLFPRRWIRSAEQPGGP